MVVIKSEERGFCAGVERAIKKADEALALSESTHMPLYFYGEIVHNSFVNDYYQAKGVIITENLQKQERGIVLVRAHSIERDKKKELLDKGFILIDATCPFILSSIEKIKDKERVIIFGKKNHPEVRALKSYAKRSIVVENEEDLTMDGAWSAVSQSTFSEERLQTILAEAKRRGIEIELLSSLCHSSVKRREEVKNISEMVDAVVVVGDKKSSNANELRLLAEKNNLPSYLINAPSDLPNEITRYKVVKVVASSSTPVERYNAVTKYLEELC